MCLIGLYGSQVKQNIKGYYSKTDLLLELQIPFQAFKQNHHCCP